MNNGHDKKMQGDYDSFIREEASLSDERVKAIFGRYHFTRFITIDDLKYLGQKDPESCKTIVQNVIGAGEMKETKQVVNSLMEIRKWIRIRECKDIELQEQDELIENPHSDIKNENIREIMESLKSQLVKMSESEQQEVLNSINETSELELLIGKMRFWDDSFTENMINYSCQLQNGFNKLA